MREEAAEIWGRAASVIAEASGVTCWWGFNEQEAAIALALEKTVNDGGNSYHEVCQAANTLRMWSYENHG